MIFTDAILLEVLILSVVLFYVASTNLTMLLYTAGLYLLLVGSWFLLSDGDIYVGFLWVIDLGVGLIFFIFILHFSSFLNQKTNVLISSRHFLAASFTVLLTLTIYYFCPSANTQALSAPYSKTWPFKVSYLDYYAIHFSREVTDLNLLKDCYFFSNSFEFFTINFSLLYGLISSILLVFLIQRVFNLLNYHEIIHSNSLKKGDSGRVIRNQEYTNQTHTQATTRTITKSGK